MGLNLHLPEKKIIQVNDLDSRKNRGKFREIKELLSSIFLPQGYPSSVSEDYLEYQIWDTVQVENHLLNACFIIKSM